MPKTGKRYRPPDSLRSIHSFKVYLVKNQSLFNEDLNPRSDYYIWCNNPILEYDVGITYLDLKRNTLPRLLVWTNSKSLTKSKSQNPNGNMTPNILTQIPKWITNASQKISESLTNAWELRPNDSILPNRPLILGVSTQAGKRERERDLYLTDACLRTSPKWFNDP